MTNDENEVSRTGGKFYTLFVDGTEYRVEQGQLTGGEIMDLAGIPRDAGLILIEEDGARRSR